MDFRTVRVAPLDFGNARKGPAPAFSLDRRDQLRRSHMRRREWRAVIMLPVAIIVVGMFIHFLVRMGQDLGELQRRTPLLSPAARLAAMPQPQLDGAPTLPTSAAIIAEGDMVNHLLAHPEAVPNAVSRPDARGLAWALAQQAQDATVPPIPQHLVARELVLGGVETGTPCLVTGRLEDVSNAQEVGGQPLVRMLLAMDEGQFSEILAPPNPTLVIGNPITVVGRVLGWDDLRAASGKVHLPVIMARSTHALDPQAGAAGVTTPDWAQPGRFELPEKIWDELDDERTYIETRPYYYALGQRQQDASLPPPDHVLDLNANADAVHQDPTKYRDVLMRVKGSVYQAWEDPQVAQDHPFGIQRVLRILLYHTDFGPITENINGEDVRKNKLVQRMFEVALVTDQPAPKPQSLIEVTGRFLKFHAVPVPENAERDRVHHVERQSDKDYIWFLVGGGYTVLPAPHMYDFYSLEIAVIATVIVMVVVFWRLSRRERRAAEAVQRQVQQLRQGRRALQARPIASAGAATPTAAPTEAPTAAAPPPPAPPADPPSTP